MFNEATFRETLLSSIRRSFEIYYLPKRSHIKHTWSWRDNLIVLWTLNRQAKIFLRIYCSDLSMSRNRSTLNKCSKIFPKKKQRMRLFLKFASTKMFFSKLTMNSSETPIFKQAKTVPLLCSCLFICCNSDMSLRKTTWLFSLWNLVGHELTVNISISYWIVPL